MYLTWRNKNYDVTIALPRPLPLAGTVIVGMVERAILPLSPSITRGLADKLVERRKAAALELEK